MDILTSEEARRLAYQNLVVNDAIKPYLVAIDKCVKTAMDDGLVECIVHLSHFPEEFMDAIRSMYLSHGYKFRHKRVDNPVEPADDTDEFEYYRVKISWES